MKMRSYFVCKQGLRPLLGATTVLMAAVLLTGCNSPADTTPNSAPAASASANTSASADTSAVAGTSGLQQVDGRGVSASDTELVLRTAQGERTFQIKEEDLQAIDPAHYNSHVGVPSLGFRVYYRTEGGVDRVVSVEEIEGSTLGFD
ncbi:hypothetical protein [Arthrobacter sp. ZGTC412]|uniref:hypothetical protein n=1 Tax=Arthrobacter sp. ZGTC412 TaxID=2058900 RepID=UPI000CE413EC|nr:hypothetical protein [Arthrobacter sp. ZGTC412]